jgi:tetratricopeptide (TPR) repeat protein
VETLWSQTTELPFGYATDPEVAIEREGIYCYDRGEYRKALRLLSHAADYWGTTGDTRRWLETSIYILRIRAEHGQVEQIRDLETRILRMLTTENPPAALQSRCHYMIGVCNTLRDETVGEAAAHFRRGIDRAVEADDKTALAYPVFGLATLLRYLKKFDEAKIELEKLEMILTCVEIPEIQLSSTILKALIHNELGDHDLALQFLWNAYSQLRRHPSVALNIHVLHSLGAVYLNKK